MTGVLVTTRPGLNLIAGLLRPPQLTIVGEEHMHLDHHRKGLIRAMKGLYPKLDAFVLLTNDHVTDYKRLLKRSAPRLEVIPNTARPLDGGKADPDTKVVFAAGRFRPQKGYDYLIPAFAQAARDRPDWKLRICGHGKMQEQLEQLREESGIADRIELEGPTDNMGEEMANASIFVLSSRFEGFPLVLLEAMSKGMAVVAFDCPTGPADIIDDHVNGLLVRPERDIDALARGIREMIEDDDLRRRCMAAAPEAAAGHTIEAIGPRWEAFFDEVSAARLA
jgi:glycosyltransferase involved in cell wall biosynthesis